MENITDIIKNRVIANIKSLLDKRNIKLGNFERSIGVQPGYISRLEKKSNVFPTFDFVYNTSRILGVDISLLINDDLTDINHSEDLIINFIQKIKNKLINNELPFYCYDSNIPSKSRIKKDEFRRIFDFNQYGVAPDYVFDQKLDDNIYFSSAFGRFNTLVGYSYCIDLRDNSYCYLIQCEEKYDEGTVNNFAIDLIINVNNKTNRLTTSLISKNIKNALYDLYNYLNMKNTSPYLDSEMETFINNFLDDKPTNKSSNSFQLSDNDDLPF